MAFGHLRAVTPTTGGPRHHMSPVSLRSPPFPWHIPGLCWLPPCPLHPILWLGGSRRRSRLATKRVIPFLAADSRCLHPAFPHARSQCSKDPGAPLGHLRRYGVPAKKKRLLRESPRLGRSVHCSAWPTWALWLVSPWGLAPVSPGWNNPVAGGPRKSSWVGGSTPCAVGLPGGGGWHLQ